jgi:alkanesulfonate monooxygenase SsuD/methylene tetrahydromethanopterin reductase-like flavin-dependent oxidoreductase (luciferase family)
VQERLPIWVGGNTRRSLRRALELGDGWVPFALKHHRLRDMLADGRGPEAVARPGFEIVLAPEPPLDPSADREAAVASVGAYAEIGATSLALRFVTRSRAHYLEQLAAMVDVMGEAGHPIVAG